MRYSGVVFLACSFTLAAPALAGPGDVSAQTFYTNAAALKKKGMGAMMDGRLKPAMAQMKAAASSVKADNKAAEARGAPIYCVPEAARKKGIDAEFVIDRLGAIPESRRRTLSLTEAWREVLVREYPCR